MPTPLPELTGAAPRRVGRYEILLELEDEGIVSRSVATVHGPNAGPRVVELSRVSHAVASQVEVRAALLAEARAAGRVRHASFVHPTDTVLHEGALYGVTEFTLGVRLDELCEAAARARRPIPMVIAVRIMLDVLAGVSALHAVRTHVGSRPVVHGDITPSTVMVGRRGEARLVFSGLAIATTRAGTVGEHTPRLAYKAPEQLRTGTTVPIAATADVFAVGVLLWECLAGERLFDAPRDLDVVERILTASIPFDVLEKRVAPSLVAVVGTALERSPERRFPSAAHFSEQLARAVGAPVTSTDDVAAFVEQLVGPLLESRLQQVQALLNRSEALASGPPSREGHSSYMRRAGAVRTPVGIIYPPAEVSPPSGRIRAARSFATPSGYSRMPSGGPGLSPPSSRAWNDLATAGAARPDGQAVRPHVSERGHLRIWGLAAFAVVVACAFGYAWGRAGAWSSPAPGVVPTASPAHGR